MAKRFTYLLLALISGLWAACATGSIIARSSELRPGWVDRPGSLSRQHPEDRFALASCLDQPDRETGKRCALDKVYTRLGTRQNVDLFDEYWEERQESSNRFFDYWVMAVIKRADLTRMREENPFVAVRLNQSVFHDGDEVELEITAAQDGYVYVLAEDLAGNLAPLFPCEASKDNFLKAEQVLKLPDEALKRAGQLIRVFLPTGRSECTETLYVLSSRSPIEAATPRGLLEQVMSCLGGDQRGECASAKMSCRIERR